MVLTYHGHSLVPLRSGGRRCERCGASGSLSALRDAYCDPRLLVANASPEPAERARATNGGRGRAGYASRGKTRQTGSKRE